MAGRRDFRGDMSACFSNPWKKGGRVFQSLEKPWSLARLAALALALAPAAGTAQLLGTNEHAHLRSALTCLNMTEADLAFQKDLGEPLVVLQRARTILADPLQLPALGDRVLEGVSGSDPASVWSLAADLLETDAPATRGAAPVADFPGALNAFLAEAQAAGTLLSRAFSDLTEAEARYAVAAYLAGPFDAEDRAPVREALSAAGLAEEDIQRAIRESLDIDPKPSSTNLLAILGKVKLGDVLAAGRCFQEAVYRLAENAAAVQAWPDKATVMSTPMGDLVAGTTGHDVYTNAALLILDPGGNDTYSGVGAANGLKAAPLAAVIDLGGNDRYAGGGLLGAAAAVFGISLVFDGWGDDAYDAEYLGQGAAVVGIGWLEDRGGRDRYRAYGHAQGAAFCGVGCLRDGGGDDRYEVGFCGQGYAGVMGVGCLADEEGNDRYVAGGRERDHERNDRRFISLSQGFATGLRPFAGGGVGALVDLDGDDAYVADVFGQGVGYWYSIGLLLDRAGDDTYRVFQYGQGTGIHLSGGLLADGAGDDRYDGSILAQGSAHDCAVGMLFDREGNDRYRADHDAQGHGMNNALAILADSAGDDVYRAKRCDSCQGIGNNGGMREYGSLAVLLDLGGADRYSCGATNGCRLLRPDFGIVYDLQPPRDTNGHE